MKNMPNIPATDSAWITLAPETLRERKIRSGISGLRGRRLADEERHEQRERRRRRARACGPAPQPCSAAGLTIV